MTINVPDPLSSPCRVYVRTSQWATHRANLHLDGRSLPMAVMLDEPEIRGLGFEVELTQELIDALPRGRPIAWSISLRSVAGYPRQIACGTTMRAA